MAVLTRPSERGTSIETLTEIVSGSRRFVLLEQLKVEARFAENHWLLDQDELEINVFAPTWEEALEDFGFLFAEHWDYYQRTPDEALGWAVIPRKKRMLELVDKVIAA